MAVLTGGGPRPTAAYVMRTPVGRCAETDILIRLRFRWGGRGGGVDRTHFGFFHDIADEANAFARNRANERLLHAAVAAAARNALIDLVTVDSEMIRLFQIDEITD